MVKLLEDETVHPEPLAQIIVNEQDEVFYYTPESNRGPIRLIELEEFAIINSVDNTPKMTQMAMDRLRLVFNLEFKMRCDRCGTAHYQDEISAPER